ncbi:MAG: AAA family ATPase [Candidatus Omnitrophica bacterium]|nr:AAA family ATPase [Candidatus Omnitrophota bacterium]
MYEEYWGLKEKPFENTPDPRFTYYSQQHEEALARMMYAVHGHKGAALLTGDYGCGKTLLSRVLWDELQKERIYQTVSILDPRLSGIQLLQEILYQMSNSPPPRGKINLFHSLYKILYSNHSKGEHTVIVVDEAQSIRNKNIFEELRLLLNFQLNNSFLLTIVLLGSPELREIIASIPQLAQRMAVSYHIRHLNEKEVVGYINHRLQVAGAARNIFSEDIYRDIYLASGGVPRRINTICDLSLLIGFGTGAKLVDKITIAKVKADMEFHAVSVAEEIEVPHPADNLMAGERSEEDAMPNLAERL